MSDCFLTVFFNFFFYACITLKMEIQSGGLISFGLNVICKNASEASHEEVHMLGFSTTSDAKGDDWLEKVTAVLPWRSTCLGTETEAKFTC